MSRAEKRYLRALVALRATQWSTCCKRHRDADAQADARADGRADAATEFAARLRVSDHEREHSFA